MLKNYLTIALRNFRRQPGYTLLNILGLTLGIAASLFILLYITEETRFDTQHLKADRIYRISSDITEPDDHFRWATTQTPLGLNLKREYPEVEEFVRFTPEGRVKFKHGEDYFYVENTYIVDSTVFDVFTMKMLRGEPGTALNQPNSLLLCASAAERIFGKNDPLGETVFAESGREYKVSGVYADWPHHSHLIPEAMYAGPTFRA